MVSIFLAVYGIMILFLGLFQSRFVFIPFSRIESTPDQWGLPYEDINFTTSDGVSLSGWFIPAPGSDKTLLFCHGNAGNISYRRLSIEIFHRLGLNVFIFDYRGYGQSHGKPTEKGTYLDAQAAWDLLVNQRKIAPHRIIVFGRSLGAAVAANLAQRHPPAILILESAFTSAPDAAAELYPFLPVRLLARFKYPTRDLVEQINVPVLIIHSKNDRTIPFKHGRSLFDAANEPKSFIELQGSHNDGFYLSQDLYTQNLKSFIQTHLK